MNDDVAEVNGSAPPMFLHEKEPGYESLGTRAWVRGSGYKGQGTRVSDRIEVYRDGLELRLCVPTSFLASAPF